MWAKQSTAATLIVGPILDSTGAEYTSAVIGDLSISKNGGTLTALAAAATLTHIANGQYTLVMTTGNLDTLGRLQITCNKSTYQMPPIGLDVVPAMVFDSMVLGTDVLQSDVIQFGGTNGTFSSGVPTVELDSAVLQQLDDIEGDTTSTLSSLSSITSAIAAIAAIFTGMTSLPNWLRRAWRKDAGTAGMTTAQTEINTGGTATFAGTTDSQEAIKDALGSSGGGPAYSAAVIAASVPVGSARGWPQEIVHGNAYLTALGTSQKLYVKDVDSNILAEMGDKTFTDVDFVGILRLSPLTDANKLLANPAATIEVNSSDSPGIVFNDDVDGEEYFELQIPKAKTLLGTIRTRYLCQFVLRWGDGTDFEWKINLGESKFIRGVGAAT